MNKKILTRLYLNRKLSVSKIANNFKCSEGKINYWLKKHSIPKRTISEAIYGFHNHEGDPFEICNPKSIKEAILYGLGLGLYWGEGTKANKFSVRLGNTSFKLIKTFILFLEKNFRIKREKLKFGLQIFNDCSAERALEFWQKELNASPVQFQKVVISRIRGEGNYKNKSQYGVLTVYFNNKKLRDILCEKIESL